MLSFDRWKEAKVLPTTHAIAILPAIPSPKTEPVAESLVASLVHPDRQASISTVKFSSDGKRLFAAGYPSGVVQIFDIASRRELRRIETPAGYRGTSDYAYLSPDWNTLYVPIEQHDCEGDRSRWEEEPVGHPFRPLSSLGCHDRRREGIACTGSWPRAGIGVSFPKWFATYYTERVDFDLENQTELESRLIAWNLKKRAEQTKLKDRFARVVSPEGKLSSQPRSSLPGTKKSGVRLLDPATLKKSPIPIAQRTVFSSPPV